MLLRGLFVLATMLTCSSLVVAGDGSSRARDSPWSDYSPAHSTESYGEHALAWIDDENFDSASMQNGCGDSIVECCDCCGACASNAHDSCIDWLLPRSNLPLPLCKDIVGDRASKLPLPLGTSAIFTELDRHVAVSDLRLGLGSTPPVSADRVDVPTTKFHASTQVARVDLWVLPCANVYGIVGHTRTTGDVAVTVDQFPLPSSGPVALNIPVVLEGPTAGFGVTSGIGGDDWFATLDVNKTWTDFSKIDGSLTALVIAPRVGLIVDRPRFKGELHVGAMWQDTAQTVELTLDHAILGNDLNVEIDQFEPDPWNFLVGGMWALDERLQLLVEGGIGGRSYIISGVMIRY